VEKGGMTVDLPQVTDKPNHIILYLLVERSGMTVDLPQVTDKPNPLLSTNRYNII
jgi:hypothetical protein